MQVYVHLPLCRRKCRYCAFASWEFSSEAAARVVDLIVAHMRRWSAQGIGPAHTIYIGGGTPSLWEARQLACILDAVDQAVGIAAGAEITVEANPESALRPGWMAALGDMGVTRLSLGVQSFRDQILAFLGRPHDSAQAVAAVQAAVATGLAVSVDLLWNVPGVPLAQWQQDLAWAVDLGVGHVSCYALTVEPGTPLAADPAPWPSEDEASAQFHWTCQFLEERGFVHYELANFARPGAVCRHNLGYWRGEDYLGVGPAAVSTWQGRRWTNPVSLEDYGLMVEGALAPEAESLSPEVVLRERVMLGLRTRDGFDVASWACRLGRDAAEFGAALESLAQAGLVIWDGISVRLSRQGMLLGNAVCAHIWDVLDRWMETT